MFIHVGLGNYINSSQIIAICRADSAPSKRMIAKAREQGMAIDATQGRKTKAVISVRGGQVVLSALLPETLALRCQGEMDEREGEEEDE